MSQQLADKFGIPLSLLEATQGVLSESDAYQAKVKAHMAKKGVKSLNDMTADQKKKFFNELDSMHKAKNEEVEELDELSKKTLGAHVAQAGAKAMMHNTQAQRSTNAADIEKHSKLASKRLSGAAIAHRKLNVEEVEELDEVSWQTAQAASNKSASKVAASKTPEEREKNIGQMKRLHKGAMSRINATPDTKKGPSGYQRSTAGRLGEEAIDEVSQETLQSYKKKAMFDLKKTNSTIGSFTATPAQKDAAAAERRKRNKGMHRALARTTANEEELRQDAEYVEEDIENLDELSNKAYAGYYKKATSVSSLTGGKSQQRRAGIKRATAGMASTAEKMRQQKEDFDGDVESVEEDVENLGELSNKAYAGYYKKATSVSSLTGGKSQQRRAGIKRATAGMASTAEKMRQQKEEFSEDAESVEEAESHQSKTTMKHIKNATSGEKKAAKDIKPGVAGYRDRIAMLHSAAARGGLKKEEVELTQEELDFIASLNEMKMSKVSYENAMEALDAESHEISIDDFTLAEIEEFMQTEDYEQLDELSKETLGSYIKKRSHDVAAMGAMTRKHAMDSEAKKKEHGGYATLAVRQSDEKSNKAFAKGWKHRQNIGKAVDKIVNKA